METESNEVSSNTSHRDNLAAPIEDGESVSTIQLLQDKLKKSDKKIEMLKKKLTTVTSPAEKRFFIKGCC